MLTIFACPKPFTDPHIAIIQRNAITSWTLLKPKPEIILFADEPGTAEICRELGLRHVPEVARNEYGTPLLNDIFEKAQQMATHDLLCYVNSDIILMSDFAQVVHWISGKYKNENFLMTGQRWNIQLSTPLDYQDCDWENHLRGIVKRANQLFRMDAIDYFVFLRGMYREVPPFALGRFSWDNWLIWKAKSMKVPILDVTPMVMVVHQDHHCTHPGGWESLYNGLEAKRNLRLAGDGSEHATILESTHILTPRGLKKGWPRKVRSIFKKRSYEYIIYRMGPLRHTLGVRRATLTGLKDWLTSVFEK